MAVGLSRHDLYQSSDLGERLNRATRVVISLRYSRIQHNMPKHAVALTWKQVHGVQDWETCA